MDNIPYHIITYNGQTDDGLGENILFNSVIFSGETVMLCEPCHANSLKSMLLS